MVVVPLESRLEIEAMVSNHDVGFVHAGQDAEVKVDTFKLTRYGLLHGQVMSISQDAISQDKPQDRFADKREGEAGADPGRQQLTYSARVSLEASEMRIERNKLACHREWP